MTAALTKIHFDHRLETVCAACPVTDQCLEYALTHDVDGVWGGMSERQRRDLRRERRSA